MVTKSVAVRGPQDYPDFDARKVTGPILIHLLRREMRFPRLFLVRCALTVGRFKSRIDQRFPKELVELTALPLWVYINLKQRIGQQKAFEIMRVAILTGGMVQWNIAYEAVDKERTFENLCEEELLVSKTGPTRWNTLEVISRTSQRFEIRVTRCLYHSSRNRLAFRRSRRLFARSTTRRSTPICLIRSCSTVAGQTGASLTAIRNAISFGNHASAEAPDDA